jgi:hypothetical protein
MSIEDELGEVMSDETEIVISETGDRRTTVELYTGVGPAYLRVRKESKEEERRRLLAGVALPPRVLIAQWDRDEYNRWIVDPDCRVSLDMAEAAALLGALAKFGGMV